LIPGRRMVSGETLLEATKKLIPESANHGNL
jgi:hypothetical protein